LEVIMPETMDPIALGDVRELVEWTQTWYEEAVAGHFVRHPYEADSATLTRLHQYFRAGLTPAEAAQACFGVKH
jgi:hypothetical protein